MKTFGGGVGLLGGEPPPPFDPLSEIEPEPGDEPPPLNVLALEPECISIDSLDAFSPFTAGDLALSGAAASVIGRILAEDPDDDERTVGDAVAAAAVAPVV